MKMAKKVFAVVLAVAMIACLTCIAFADPVGSFYLTAQKDGTDVTVTLYAKDAIGFKAGSALITYDPAVLEYSYAEVGADAAEVNTNCIASKNGYTGLDNGEEAGLIDYGFYFTETLGTIEQFQSQAKKSSYVWQLDPNNFACAEFYFTIKDETAPKAVITLNGTGDCVAENVTAEVVIAGEPVVTTTASVVTTTATVEPTKPEVTTDGTVTTTAADTGVTTTAPVVVPTTSGTPVPPVTHHGHGDKPMGDNGVLAIVAGVCALAGAAFVATKKRK